MRVSKLTLLLAAFFLMLTQVSFAQNKIVVKPNGDTIEIVKIPTKEELANIDRTSSRKATDEELKNLESRGLKVLKNEKTGRYYWSDDPEGKKFRTCKCDDRTASVEIIVFTHIRAVTNVKNEAFGIECLSKEGKLLGGGIYRWNDEH